MTTITVYTGCAGAGAKKIPPHNDYDYTVQAVLELEPARYRDVLAEFVWSLVTEMDFWINRMENITVSIYHW